MKKTFLLFMIAFFLITLLYADNIYLSDGTKLVGKIVNYNENTADILLENGQFVNVNKNLIVHVEPVDSPTADEIMTGVPIDPSGLYTASDYSNQGIATQFPSGPIIDLPVAANELPTMYADPDIEMRKRMLMYSDLKKEPWIAAELSLIIPSAGHLYTGEWERGFLFLGARAAFGGVGIFGFAQASAAQSVINDSASSEDEISNARSQQSSGTMLGTVGIGGFALFTLLEFVDAYYAAERYNQVLRLRLGIEKFDPMMLPTFGK
ncbi:MAG TPA: hypothetical protein PLN92_10215 [Thermotogota bacterium]|nr:hypothetical protein [Thermotogota bacterium]